jgi:four helix bundle protein
MHRFKDLKVWKMSMELTTQVYDVTKTFPKSEQFGLTNQIRRSAVSIPSNIAEGAGRNSPKDFVNFLSIANGSCCELETQLTIATHLDYLEMARFEKLSKEIDHIYNMNFKLQETLRKKSS